MIVARLGMMLMATRTQVILRCDLCGDLKNVQTRAFGLDGKAYEIDLCPEDGSGLSRLAASYLPKARKITSGQGGRLDRRTARPEPAASDDQASGGARQQKGIYVYGILPADIEMAGQTAGVGEDPGILRVVCSDGVAALISEVDVPVRRGSPADRRTYREILDAAATEVPVLPLRFGTVLASEDQVAGDLLAAHHDEFAAALHELEGRAEYLVRGRYLGEIINEAVTVRREQDTRALEQAVQEICAAIKVLGPARKLDAVHVALLADTGRESELEQVIEDLARAWEGRIKLRLLGPMAAYDFAATAAPALTRTW